MTLIGPSARRLRDLGTFAGVAIVYIVSARIGLTLAFVDHAATAVWPPAGIALAALLILGHRLWPAIFLGALVVNSQIQILTWPAVLAIAAGNTIEALVAAWLVRKFASGAHAFECASDVCKFAALTACVATPISATIGTWCVVAGGAVSSGLASMVWLTWWTGDTTSALVVAPLLLAWALRPRVTLTRTLEAAGLGLAVAVIGPVIFLGWPGLGHTAYPVMFLCFPLLTWAAFRFGPRGTATAVAALSVIAILGTVNERGPFVLATQNSSLLMLQAFMAVTSVMALAMAAVVQERNSVEAHLHRLAITDPLTGLSNYRHLHDVLNRHLAHAHRSSEPFAVLLLDVDGLKAINDRDGHVAGSRVLRRLAAAIRRVCSVGTTMARYGGDEFAVILPGTDEPAAREIGATLREQLAAEHERPTISISLGIAVFPRDGSTIDRLLDVADHQVYEEKHRGRVVQSAESGVQGPTVVLSPES